MNDTTSLSSQKRSGLLESAILRLFTRNAQVLDITDIGSAFRMVTLGGEALRHTEWTPGDKMQIQLGGWQQRTYTPIDWDNEKGRTHILIYLHADGPGTQWARTLHQGDSCMVFGPRRSVRLAQPQLPVILFGDETSLGLAAALSAQVSPPALQMLFEVSNLADTMPVIEQFQLTNAHGCVRLENEGHLGELETQLSALLQAHPTAAIVLTGKASSIQRMGRLLRQHDIPAGQRQSKAYWATGKTGLD
jgi:ferric-chelate reductase (NADPH)